MSRRRNQVGIHMECVEHSVGHVDKPDGKAEYGRDADSKRDGETSRKEYLPENGHHRCIEAEQIAPKPRRPAKGFACRYLGIENGDLRSDKRQHRRYI